MTKKLFIITLLLLIFAFGLYKVADNFETFFPVEELPVVSTGALNAEKPQTQKEINKQIVQEKIAKLKARYAQKWLILAGDDHLKNNEYSDAIQLYNAALKKSPKDETLIKKVADAYFGAKRYSVAYKRYRQLIEYSNFDVHKTWLALSYWVDNTPINKQFLWDELAKFGLEGQEKFYYENLVQCIDDFHLCKKNFGEYFATQTWVTHPWLLSISWAIENYENFQVDQLYYKNTLILKALYDDKNYPLAIVIGKDILKQQPWYRPVLKIIAQSYFELGTYDKAKKYLSEVYELDQTDVSVIYMLGVVHSELEDYILSNIFFNKALKWWFTPSIYVRRFLINNYIDLGSPEKALKVFSDMYTTESDWLTSEDLKLAVYYNIVHDNSVTAKTIIAHALEKFPDEADFYGFAWWIEKESVNLVGAMEQLNKWYAIDPDNAMITLNIAQIAIAEKNKSQAIVYLKQTITNDRDGQFGSVAQELLDEL